MNKRLFAVLAVLVLMVCALPMVVGAAEHEHVMGSYVQEIQSEATCTAAGSWREAYYCSCGKFFKYGDTHVIDPKPHNQNELVPGTPATCTTNGVEDAYRCDMCHDDATKVGGAPIVAQSHQPGTPTEEITLEPKCGVPGEKKIITSCTVCKNVIHTERVTINALEHDSNEIIPEVPASCLTDGKTEGKKCSKCGETQVEGTVIKAYGSHDENNITDQKVVVEAATCTKTGFYRIDKVCGRCGETVSKGREQVEELKPHTPVEDKAVAPTCEKTGLTAGSHCDVCKTDLVKQEVVKALGHKWDEGKITKNATYYETGIKTYTCLNDASHTYEEATPVLQMFDDPNLDSVPRTGSAFIEWLYALIFG